MLRRSGTLVVLIAAACASGCLAPLPHGYTDGAGFASAPCGECVVEGDHVWSNDELPLDPHWEKCKRHLNKAFRPDLGYELPPAVPLSGGPPSRFHPVPVRPAFAPREATYPPSVGPHVADLPNGGGPRL